MNPLPQITTLLAGGRLNRQSPKTVAFGDGIVVESYDELIEKIAIITFNNPELNLFYRGQPLDYKMDNGCSSLYPSFFRLNIKRRKNLFNILNNEFLNKLFKYNAFITEKGRPNATGRRMARYPEAGWAILQHYGVSTPLLDISQSLYIAASFASLEEEKDFGYIYVLGLPNINGYISYFAYEGLVLVKLQSTCPPEAKRPHYQEGYLVGSFPHGWNNNNYKNFSHRLVCKFKFNKKTFWDSKYQPLEKSKLYVEDDDLGKFIQSIN